MPEELKITWLRHKQFYERLMEEKYPEYAEQGRQMDDYLFQADLKNADQLARALEAKIGDDYLKGVFQRDVRIYQKEKFAPRT